MNIKTIIFAVIAVSAAAYFFYLRSDVASSEKVQEWIDRGALIADVRTPEEYAAIHFKGSVNIPLGEIEMKLDEFGDREDLIVLYCRTGNRSGQAKAILERNGFKNVINAGGLRHMGL